MFRDTAGMDQDIMTRIDQFVIALGEDIVAIQGANDPEHDETKSAFHEVAHIGGDPAYWLGAAAPLDLRDTGGSEPVFISFYTRDTPYEAMAARLRETLDAYGLEHRLVGVDSLGLWERNCAYKARFVRDQWRALGRPVVWLDADATVEADPVVLRQCGADFAACKWEGWELCSGTLFFNATPAAGRLLDRWVLRCEADPLLWDQMHLDAAWADIASEEPLITQWLPTPYLHIFDHRTDKAPVIKHWQASREHKAAVSDGVSRPKPFISLEVREARRFSRFRRSYEALFWGTEGVDHIKPEIGLEHPEGFDVPALMRELAGPRLPLLEIGCGVGRLATGFAPGDYIGVDVNPHALLVAREALPAHDFRLITEESVYPEARSALFYTVLLHVPDDALEVTLRRTAAVADRIIIGEVMDRRWRRPGNPPVFNRESEDYIQAMQALGYLLADHVRLPYARYDTAEFWNRRDTRLTMLVFERAEPRSK